MDISKTGLDVEWRRLEVIAQNLANINSVTDGAGNAYRPMHMVSGPTSNFSDMLAGGKRPAEGLNGVAVYSIEPENNAPSRVYEPSNPQADADGYVTYPGFNHAAEMALMVKTSRAYEANIVAMNTARQMYLRALDIGKR
jgi:flagellar basal-body rod protein FlgC